MITAQYPFISLSDRYSKLIITLTNHKFRAIFRKNRIDFSSIFEPVSREYKYMHTNPTLRIPLIDVLSMCYAVIELKEAIGFPYQFVLGGCPCPSEPLNGYLGHLQLPSENVDPFSLYTIQF